MAKAPKLAELEPDYIEAVEKVAAGIAELRRKQKMATDPAAKAAIKSRISKLYGYHSLMKKDAELCKRYYEGGFKDYALQL